MQQIPRSVWALLLAETLFRYSFFGVVGIFTTTATKTWGLTPTGAALSFSLFYATAWIACIPGGWLADRVRRRVLVAPVGGILYFAGLCLAGFCPRCAPYAIVLFALGFGCLRPLLSTLLGDQFEPGKYVLNETTTSVDNLAPPRGKEFDTREELRQSLVTSHEMSDEVVNDLLQRAYDPRQEGLKKAFFAWSYIATNVGALVGFMLTPVLKTGLGVPCTLEVLGATGFAASLIILSSSRWLRIIPPSNQESHDPPTEGSAAASSLRWRLAVTILCVASFWLVYNRTHDRVLIQAADIVKPDDGFSVLGWTLKPDQLQALNPFFIILLTAPLRRRFPSSDLDSMLVGYYFLIAFIVVTLALQVLIASASAVNIFSLILSYGLVSVAEVFLAVPASHTFYNLSRSRRALSMGLLFASIGVGELASAALNWCWTMFFPSATAWNNVGFFLLLTAIALIATLSLFALRGRQAADNVLGGH